MRPGAGPRTETSKLGTSRGNTMSCGNVPDAPPGVCGGHARSQGSCLSLGCGSHLGRRQLGFFQKYDTVLA